MSERAWFSASVRSSAPAAGRARRLAVDPAAAKRRADVLRVPSSVTSLGPALSAAAALVRTAEEEAKAVTEELDEPEREALRRAFGEGSSGKGVAKAMRGMAGAMKDLEDRQKSRATRVKRDTLDQALLELALFYRDILMLQLGAGVELANPESGLRKLASSSTPIPSAGPRHPMPWSPVAIPPASARSSNSCSKTRRSTHPPPTA